MRILVAEDEKDLNRLVTEKLVGQHYSVDTCFNGREALDYLESTSYDCAVLDIMMPYMSGLDLVRRLRAKGNKVPVIFLTARDTIEDRVQGLDSGANDYLVKPFSLDELMARVRALTRNSYGVSQNIMTVGDLIMDLSTHRVKRGEREILLSSKEYALLEYLMYNKNTVLSRERIEDHIWNYDYEGGTNVVDVYISYLRKKIDKPGETKLIHTVRGSGYVLKES
ncbi:MAG: response regulator transcription factor [Lachnospiraceae bacterium]|nr:response regulator transcription factor [Lachnospiraceae bacterium]